MCNDCDAVANKIKPLFVHDCDQCIFLGSFNDCDLYVHTSPIWPTVIARWSSDGPDYYSGLMFADTRPELGEAKRRAESLGLLKP
jgi:hypothetical protein